MLMTRMMLGGVKVPPLPNISGANEWVHDDYIYPAGRYRVEVASGCGYFQSQQNDSVGFVQEVVMTEKFIIRAYCGSAGTSTAGGVNPYSGSYKRSAIAQTAKQANGGIFGNSGGVTLHQSGRTGSNRTIYPSGGPNCLGNGARLGVLSSGAGTCLHFLPVGGTFGEDYLRCFHCAGSAMPATATTSSRPRNACGGGGGAYGGGGGAARSFTNISMKVEGYDGGDAAGGQGGKGGGTSTAVGVTQGTKGSGVGAGDAGVAANAAGQTPGPALGGVAFFDGANWIQPTRFVRTGTGMAKVEKLD